VKPIALQALPSPINFIIINSLSPVNRPHTIVSTALVTTILFNPRFRNTVYFAVKFKIL